MSVIEKDKPRLYVTIQPIEIVGGKKIRGESRALTITDLSRDEVYDLIKRACSGTSEKKRK